ncbi:MAG TPA: MarR family winged helix-turn-helix transcriptional regulator [Alphaproteobacteria bacterium]|nr:MarR family winged helix-turn-helix transcriptional regulator [Alphaproteobacteria bacterium]
MTSAPIAGKSHHSELIALIFLLSRIGRLNEMLLTTVQADLIKASKKPRTETECHVLISLLLQGEPYSLSPTTLCEFSMQTPGGMTKTLNRLEKDSLIRRRTDRNDRRALLVELTAKGLKSTRALLGQTVDGYAKAFGSLSPTELKEVAQALRSILTILEKATGTEPTDMWVSVDRVGGIPKPG